MACSCRWFESEAQLQQLYDQSDAVFIGRAFAAIAPRTPGTGPRLLGPDVLVQVTRWKKGRPRRDTVLVLQTDSNSARAFTKGETVYVFARDIRRVQVLPPQAEEPYSHFDESQHVFFRSGEPTEVNQYQQWAKRFPAVTTNQCASFTKDHRLVPASLQAKAEQ
ncbi:hypothetical protein GCM10028822_43070 [Hymenobacter terrigena]